MKETSSFSTRPGLTPWPAGPGAQTRRHADHQRHAEAGIVHPPLAPRQPPAVVAPEPHDRAVRQPVGLQLVQHGLDMAVQLAHPVVVAGHVLPDDRRVGPVRRQRRLGRVVPLAARRPPARARLVRDGEVEHGEERLIPVRAIAPVGPPAGLVPRRPRRGELVVRLIAVRAVVSRRPEVLGEAPGLNRRHAPAAHPRRADSGRVHARDDARSGGRADGCVGEGRVVPNALCGELVQVRRRGIRVAVTAERRADVLGADPDDVRPGRALPRRLGAPGPLGHGHRGGARADGLQKVSPLDARCFHGPSLPILWGFRIRYGRVRFQGAAGAVHSGRSCGKGKRT